MNLLAIDATKPSVAFAVYATAPVLEAIVSGSFECDAADDLAAQPEDDIESDLSSAPYRKNPITVFGADGRIVTEYPIPESANNEACLSWVMQWLNSKQVRIDVIAHRQVDELNDATHYLKTAWPGLPQVACATPAPGVESLAVHALRALSLPAPALSRQLADSAPPSILSHVSR